MGPGQQPRYTDARKGRPSLSWQLRSRFVETENLRGSVDALRQEHVQEPTGSFAGDPARDSAGELRDHTFNVIKTLNLMDQHTKKLTSQVGDVGSQDIADIVKLKDTIKELDLLKNTKSSKKYKISIDKSAETVEKAKTTINNIVLYYHDEVTHLDEVHEECVVQLS